MAIFNKAFAKLQQLFKKAIALTVLPGPLKASHLHCKRRGGAG